MSETGELTGPLRKIYEQAGALVFRMQAGRVKVRGGWMQLCPEGTADLLVFPRNGGTWWVETKHPKSRTDRVRAEKQAEFQQKVEALGHKYIKPTTIDEGLQAI